MYRLGPAVLIGWVLIWCGRSGLACFGRFDGVGIGGACCVMSWNGRCGVCMVWWVLLGRGVVGFG